ncbi:hypothetical protein LINPERHAP2_LOCUS33463, partial [Linum perenne]
TTHTTQKFLSPAFATTSRYTSPDRHSLPEIGWPFTIVEGAAPKVKLQGNYWVWGVWSLTVSHSTVSKSKVCLFPIRVCYEGFQQMR